MVQRGQPLYAARKPRPHIWRSGPDPIDHAIYKTFLTSRAQANFRNEVWELTWEQYRDIWRPDWSRRGRDSNDLCLSRRDFEGAWSVGNVELITRREKTQAQIQYNKARNDDLRARGLYVKHTRKNKSGGTR